MLATENASHAIPLAPSLAALSIPELMLSVIRRNAHEGQPTTRADFQQAEETCHLSDAQLDANIGAAKRLANQSVIRHDQPPAPVMAWDHDPEYRRQRVTFAAFLITGNLPGDDVAVAALRSAHYSTAEIAALWPEIMRDVGHRVAIQPLPRECRP